MSYPVTVRDGIRAWCSSCAQMRVIYVQVEDGVGLTCCGTCQRILKREKDVPSLSRYGRGKD